LGFGDGRPGKNQPLHVSSAALQGLPNPRVCREIRIQKRNRLMIAMGNLADTLGHQGQLDEAAKMMKKMLGKKRRILGEENPSTISTINNLASTLGD